MLFNSVSFLVFFPVVTALYFWIPWRFRWSFLLLASSIFYMSFIPAYILILAAVITIDYVVGILIESSTGKKRKLYLIISLTSNIGILFAFKYFNFINADVAEIAAFFDWNYSLESLKLILPIGLSFHTFQSMSYIIEVFRGNYKAERHLGIFALYVMFYPQLVAGPIERPSNLIPQFYEQHSFDPPRVTQGLQLMLWGFFKKIVIANRLALIVDAVYNNPYGYTGIPLIVATVFFTFQIYCDFSGYSDIARGAAQVMGFKLMNNFNRPYFSKSISEFWRRWHISLSSWFKEYVYLPLGGNRISKVRTGFNIIIVFFISGMWHGANWTYIAWGLWHGLYLIFSLISRNLRNKGITYLKLDTHPRIHTFISTAMTILLVGIAWIFFRANTLLEAVYILKNIFSGMSLKFSGIWLGGATWAGLTVACASILLLVVMEWSQEKKQREDLLSDKRGLLRSVFYLLLTIIIIVFGTFKNIQFIYFQF